MVTVANDGYVVLRRGLRSYRADKQVAGPFGTWLEAFLARCRLSEAAARDPLSYADLYEVRPAAL